MTETGGKLYAIYYKKELTLCKRISELEKTKRNSLERLESREKNSILNR